MSNIPSLGAPIGSSPAVNEEKADLSSAVVNPEESITHESTPIPQQQPKHDEETSRVDHEIQEEQRNAVIHEGQTLPTGFFPSVVGTMAVPAVVPTISAETSAAPIDTPEETKTYPTEGMSEKGKTTNSSDTDSTNDEKVVAKKRWGRKKKEKEESEKKSKQKEKEAEKLPSVAFLSLFRFATPFELFLDFIGLALAIAAGATQPLMTLIFGRLTTSFNNYAIIANNLGSNPSPQGLEALEAAKAQLKTDSGHNALYLLAIGVGMFLTVYGFMFIWSYTGEMSSKRTREAYLRAVLRQEIAYFDDLGAGEVATRIETDCHLVQDGMSEKVAQICMYLSTFVTGYVLAYVRSWRLALALSSILPVILMAGGAMSISYGKYLPGSLAAVSRAGTLAEEVIASIRTVHAFGTRKVIGGKFDTEIDAGRKLGIKGTVFESLGLAVMFFAIYSAYALAFFYGGILVTQGHGDVGVVINVFMSVLIGSFSMAMIAPDLGAVSKAQAAAAKLFATIDRVPLIDSSDPGGLKPEFVEGTISFEGVKFHYPSRPDVPILKGLTTTFAAGNTVALVGASGSGKSTVVALVERFYDPISGTVKLDGRDIKTLNLKWLRQQIGLVSQEPTLFGTTVRGNVEHGLIGSRWENASTTEKFELVKKACIDANAHDFIMKLPNGYETHVGERGMLLSGGQKQRVAIARAIVSDPRILLLDEATSALDTQSEGIVQDALDKASKGRTTIVIAHRLSTIKDADQILLMGGGEILEQGTHWDLLANETGPYAQLVTNQKLNQTAAEKPSDDVIQSDPDAILAPADSPLSEKGVGFPGLGRVNTGRSLASAVMDKMRTERAAEEAASEKLPSSWKMYYRLININKEDKFLYISGFIAAVCSGMVYPALAILFGQALSDFQIQDVGEFRAALDRKALFYFITAILASFAIAIQVNAFARSGWHLASKLRKMTFDATLRHDIEWFDEEKNSTGAITSNIADLPQKVQGLFGPTMGTIIQSCATLVGGCIIGLIFGPLLALIGIACIPLLVSTGYIRLKVVVLKDQMLKKIHAGSAHMASEAASAVRTVASLTREDDIDNLYQKALEEPMKLTIRTSYRSQALYAFSQGLSFPIIALVFYVGSLWLVEGKYTTAHFFTVLTAVIFASIQAGNVFSFVPDASKAKSSTAAIFRLLDDVPEIDADATEGIQLKPEEVKGHIRLEGIHFRYPSRPTVRVLRDLTIDVPPGTYVALVGPSGCGKSTSIQMLERFYDPLIGKVTLDGVDIREINVASYRNQMALVSQEPTLYAGTIRFNVLLGANKPMDQVPEEDIIQACKDANIHDFITSLPDGFNTEVGGKGSQLSGGQKQRIAIARALIRNPKVLLLDEATSALDSQSERVVQDALDKAAAGRTTIAIAHRLSTIQKADIIYCFADGQVAEKGTHSELIARKGPYYELVQMQNLSRQE